MALKENALGIFLNAGVKKESPDHKTLSSAIASAKKITIRYEWRCDAESGKGRYSFFNLKDSGGNIIFSLYGNGAKGVTFAANEAAGETSVKVANAGEWIRVKLDLDFDTKKISGTLLNLATGTETSLSETSLTKAANLATLNAEYGYSAAPQILDNFGIRYTAD